MTSTATVHKINPFLTLNYEPAIEALGNDYFDQVTAAQFPQYILRFRNDLLLPLLGLDPQLITDTDFIEAFGKFQGRQSLLALRYHGYQFGQYNPSLGDGRGFLYGQVRGTDGELYDFGTKGSGTTPYSRGGDGRLTLKGGVREVLAAEALHQMGVRTSRCLSMIETGEQLWRGDEPSPTRSSVMVRFNRSHIRFGTFERLHYIERPDLIKKLLDHVIEYYYPDLQGTDKYIVFYAQLVKRVAELTAQWMAAGFCHGVLNTDNMSITGESFDYGPYAFIPSYDPQFTAAYFDYYRRYSYGNQPLISKLNLELLQVPLEAVVEPGDMEAGLAMFDQYYNAEYKQLMLTKLGVFPINSPDTDEFLKLTIDFLKTTQVGYHDFFAKLTTMFSTVWSKDTNSILSNPNFLETNTSLELLENWLNLYHRILTSVSESEIDNIAEQMKRNNPKTVLLRPVIESIWEPIANEDNWQPFNDLVTRIQAGD